MTQFLVLLVGKPPAVGAQDAVTREYNAKWMAWMGDLAASGALRGGAPLVWGGRTVAKESVTPLEMQSMDVGGYLVIEAASAEAVAEILQSSPSIQIGGEAIIRECVPVG
ncbi:YciI family protein [Actinocrispum sp. NPDC049592]|uniref:YciI family protein n=1 Tax=Actinocrispum sp. NPDC049592 TaxID=3154835 RepID=UPI003415F0C1